MLNHIASYANKIVDYIFSDGFDTTRSSILGLVGGMAVFTFSPLAVTGLKVAGALMMALVSSMVGNLGKDIYQRHKRKYGWFKDNETKE